ncbi:RICIN domain-containing protein [Streptosporangiaceae bacterium NEAU-GS5]|nr:RICIN domain-containing protein [Streptosporangiaceae bacterium NEAU-GS5]
MRKLRAIVSLLVIATATAIVAGAFVRPAFADFTDLPEGPIHIVNYGSGKCLAPAPDNRVWQRACDGSADQEWLRLRSADGAISGFGNVQRHMLVNRSSGRCMDVKDGSTANGAVIQMVPCNGNSNTMLWGVFDDYFGSHQLVDARTGTCLDVQGGSLADNAYLQGYRCTVPNTAQHFYLGW